MPKRVAIIGAGPAGLMAAEVLSQYDYEIDVFEQKPSAARKFLMAGKTGLNISHAEPVEAFIQRYDQTQWLGPWVKQWDAQWIQNWMQGLGIESYVGSSGLIRAKEKRHWQKYAQPCHQIRWSPSSFLQTNAQRYRNVCYGSFLVDAK